MLDENPQFDIKAENLRNQGLADLQNAEPFKTIKQWRGVIAHLVLFSLAIGYYAHLQISEGQEGPLSFLILGLVVLVPLERFMPRHNQRILRPGVHVDLLHAVLTGLLAYLPVMLIFPLLDSIRSQSLTASIAELPLLAQIALAFLAQEFLIYWGHRFSHEIPFLWRFHSVHHSSEKLDWLAGERRHPIDGAIMAFFVGVPLLFLGFDLIDLLWLGVFNSLWDMTIHANLRWRLRFMQGLWVTTEYHHWHHVADQNIRNRNYAGALPVFDWLFGTYYLPKDKSPSGYGIDTPMPNSYLGQLSQPFRLNDRG